MSQRRLLPLVAVAALVFVAAMTGLAAARGPNPNAVPTAQQVDDRTMSPFCVGLTLAACPSTEALQLRAAISDMVAQRRTNREIDAFLLASYPKTVIGAPRNPVAWLVPALAMLVGLAVVVTVAFRRWGGPDDAGFGPGSGPGSSPPDGPPPPLSPGDGARLAADLRRFAEGVSE